MNNDLISREDLKKKLQARHDNGEDDFDKGYNIGIETAIDLLDNAPTADVVCPECYIRYSQGYIDGATNNPKECKACDYYKLAQSFINGIVEVISKNGLTNIDELLEILKREANKNE